MCVLVKTFQPFITEGQNLRIRNIPTVCCESSHCDGLRESKLITLKTFKKGITCVCVLHRSRYRVFIHYKYKEFGPICERISNEFRTFSHLGTAFTSWMMSVLDLRVALCEKSILSRSRVKKVNKFFKLIIGLGDKII